MLFLAPRAAGRRRAPTAPAAATLLAALCGGAACTAFQPDPLTPPGTSVGAPNDGWLVEGAPVPDRAAGLRAYRDADRRHGSRRTVEIVTETAAWLAARHEGAVLHVGDLSTVSGGKIPGHSSHRSGRDVDLLFFTLRPDGTPATSARFHRFGADGLAVGVSPPVRLDLERNWALIEHLLEEYPQDVQWIFVSWGVKTALISWALAVGARPATVERALSVLHQPSDSLPHDDHFHVRFYCAPEDLPWGCADRPPIWPWVRRRFDRTAHAPADDDVLRELALGSL
ncbi:MAG: penicillin-insensitive murein endopeptidase [Myxococcales bacterium]|nr:penicillin-insensitive murein endopeptidase [Myxococcales bacterium]